MPPQHLANLILHIGAGVLGLLIGLAPLVTRKGGPTHRRWGRVFALFAGVVVATAIFSDLFSHPPAALAAVTLSAGYQLFGAERSLALRDRARPNAYDALAAFGALALAALILVRGGPANAAWTPAIEYATLGYVAALAFYDLSRHAWSPLWAREVRPLDHGLKMIGVWVAMASAGTGNLLRNAPPLNQILPPAINMVGVALMLAFGFAYIRRLRPASVKLRGHEPLFP